MNIFFIIVIVIAGLISASIPVFLVLFIRGKLHLPIKPLNSDVNTGIFYSACLKYGIKLEGNEVTQWWQVSPDLSKNYLKNIKNSTWKSRRDQMLKDQNQLNRFGVKESLGRDNYGRKVKYKLSKPEEEGGLAFTQDQYREYVRLMNKCELFNLAHEFGSLPRKAWTRAYLRNDMWYKYKGLTPDEADHLAYLIYLKRKFTEEVRHVQAFSPMDDGFLYAHNRQKSIDNGSIDVLFEKELEDIRLGSGVYEHDPEKVLGYKGVYVGGSWCYKEKGNFLTFGGTRSGKGVNLIIPQLLWHETYDPGSIVAVDIKGTLTAITARHLKESGFETIILDPWNTQEKIGAKHGITSSNFNPFDILSENPEDLIDDCQLMASILVPKRQKTADSHWDDKARQWVATYIYYLASDPNVQRHQRTLSHLRSLFKKGADDRNRLFYDIINGQGEEFFKDDVRAIEDMFDNSQKEAMGILSNVQRELDIFKSPGLSKNTSWSSFDIKSITQGKTRLFVVIDNSRLETHSKWLNLIIASLITTVRRHSNERVLMILDEFHTIGYMELLEKSMGFMPEYNMQIWAIMQDLSQLKSMYPKSWETFIANAAATTWLGLEGNETPDYLSKLISTKHVKYKKDQTIIDELLKGVQNSTELYEVPMQSALQIRESDDIFARVKGLKLCRFAKLPYYETTKLRDRADENPLLKLD